MFLRGRIARALLVLLFLCAVVSAQTVSIETEHSHQHSSQHCCGLCHIGPLPLLQPVASAEVAPTVAVAWLSSFSDCDFPHEVLLAAGSSRAPPSTLPV
jgi:uncharacterized membrane protein